jgi:pimeloyl-ACP methyl ester carboxylesterase
MTDMKEVRLSQGTVRYRDEGSGAPIVFVHGLLVNGRLWERVVERLRDRHRCIVPDLPLGSHTLPMDEHADLSAPGVARLVAEMLESLELEDVTLVGNDSGGAISQIVATRHPQRIGRLVLTNCDLYENFPPKLFAYLKPAARIPGLLSGVAQTLRLAPLRRSPLAYGVLTKSRIDSELLESWVRPGIEDRRVRRDSRKFILDSSPEQTLRAAAELEGFGRPALFAWAPEDRWFPIAGAERLAASMPDARVHRIDDSKTFVSIDQPERLAEEIAGFVGGGSATAPG